MAVKSTFAERIKELRGNMKQAEFGEKVGVSRGAISYYENGSRTADIEILEKICREYSVTSDWLLGLSDVKNPDIELQAICKRTGLSEDAINMLQNFEVTKVRKRGDIQHKIKFSEPLREISELLCNPTFIRIVYYISQLKQIKNVQIFQSGAFQNLYKYLGEYEFYKWLSRNCVDEFANLLNEIAPYQLPENRRSSQYDLDKFLF